MITSQSIVGPTISYLGHAGFIVRHRGLNLLMDPWFFPAFLHSWFPYPDNRHLLPEVVHGRFDALYLSHAHEDHFDERLLRQLDNSLRVLIPRYRSKVMVRRLAAMGFANVQTLNHGEQYLLGEGFSITMLLDTSHKEDSGVLLDLSGFRFLDLNDCNPKLSDLPSDVDLLAAQFSGAMWYPNCYAYPPDLMAQKVAAVRKSIMDTVVRKVKLTNARSYLPSAGPPCFLDPALEKYNDRAHTIFPHWPDVQAEFFKACPETQVLVMAPGDETLPLKRGSVAGLARGDYDATVTDERAYLLKYREKRRDEWQSYYGRASDPISATQIEEYFRRLQKWNVRFLRGYRKDIRLVADGTHWGVRLGRLADQFVLEDDPSDPDYTLHVPTQVLRAILTGQVGWEEALLSMRLSLRRSPDVFDVTLMSLLRYGDHPAQTMQLVRERENRETIDRDGLRLQRFCPHAGEDLAYATISNGILECPRHHWKWDVQTGQCVDGGTVSLRIAKIGVENTVYAAKE